MIRYRLHCKEGHEFDGWFAGSAGYDAQRAAGQIACPVCGSAQVEKSLMAPAVAVREETSSAATVREKTAVFAPDPHTVALQTAIRQLREKVAEKADYVGDHFADEARKIHYEEAESRSIYGEATAEDARSLHEEGIEFHPLPALPEDRN